MNSRSSRKKEDLSNQQNFACQEAQQGLVLAVVKVLRPLETSGGL